MGESARALLDRVSAGFTELAADLPDESGVDGPIGWTGYGEARARARARTGERESVVCGTGLVGGAPAVLVAFEFGFLGGSLGGATGARIAAAFARARELRRPLVALVATGGSRMQEGMRALSQLQRIAAESARNRELGLPLVAVLRDPTTGGGWATLGAGADVTLAVAGAQVGFAGSRVRPPGDHAAYTAESQLAHGHADRVLAPAEVPDVLGRWVRLLGTPSTEPAPPPAALRPVEAPATGWAAVRAARVRHSGAGTRADAYLDAYFAWREDISGDRCGGVDTGVRCGFGWRAGRAVAYAAQCGTPTAPAGFRAAARLVRLADRLGIPVLTLVDTPGAANDAAAERAGVGPAIAELFGAVAAARVPVTTLVIGEGGSGGALAFAAPGRTWVTPDSYFSVTSPEAAAAILKRPPEQVPAVADQLRLRPQDLVDLDIARGIVTPVPPPG
ncbi:acetyl-CoA carboxylase carboxyl transferase subunit beta [Amycolatopsis arida]|uniref:Acetyl-coenzyme A carboxylase carboxyl transferase subunits beta/alpha n=1 Tax=Amycolatopsis arida TaxID=587909 RepID=A0A1I5X190_9PSEU|nr:carboxyl transferase domain-containing protein [Amycolatopsis arida]TDX92552.1 acetyl-CoA carboxylase carboxyl transferase subunit beta [Amycolatopsis arida]SFQ25684.1 acetyl-CoA carboxylase carboxyl transferase subunit beta [Amycolatopsis arida]